MIITITGDEGAGKSTVAEILAKKIGFERFYMGQILRDLARKKGMSLVELLKYGENHSEIDRELDEYQIKLGQEKNDFIIEGRTSWFLIPNSVKIFIKVDPLIGAERIFKNLQQQNKRNEGNSLDSVKDVLENNKKRRESDDFRYKKYYGKECFNEANFDLVIDSSYLTPEEVLKKIVQFVQEKK